MTLRIPAPYRDSLRFFHICLGSLCEFPRSMSYPAPAVQVDLTPRQAVYTSRSTGYRQQLRKRIVTYARAIRRADGIVSELADQQQELNRSLADPRSAHREIEAQKAQLHAQVRELESL